MNHDQAVIAGLAVATAAAAADMFGRVLPPAYTVAGQPATAANIDAVRRQCLTVLPVALAFGAGAALLARSWWPLVGAAAGVAFMAWQYDHAAKADGGQLGAVAQTGRYAR